MTSEQTDQTLDAALAQHQAGGYAAAEALYRQVLENEADHPDALHLLGLLALQLGRNTEALDLLTRAVAADAEIPEFHLHLGVALEQTGRSEDAIAAYQQVLALEKDQPQAVCNLSSALWKQGKIALAIQYAQKAIALLPASAEAYNNLGNALKSSGDLPQALAAFRQAISLKPQFAQAHGNLGAALLEERSLEENPGALAEAINACYQAVALSPDLAEAQTNLGAGLLKQYAIDASPQTLEGAVLALRRAVELRPGAPEVAGYLASALYARGSMHEAISLLRRVVTAHPDFAVGQWYLGLMLLSQGKFEEGWPGYEWRFRVKQLKVRSNVGGPMWNGSDLGGKRILLHAEQGFGDAIQFVRYVPQVIARGGKVILAAQPELRRLLEKAFAIEHWVLPRQPLPEYDAQCPLMSLPNVFKTKLETIPGETYLSADPELARTWAARVPSDGRMKVGLVWAGRPTHTDDRNRSIAARLLSPLAQVENIWWCSLQKGAAARAARELPLAMADWADELGDFADTAALIANLDLVITVDTAVAHLAGAMGKPVWILLPYVADWRWMTERTDSPWYPSMGLFRQPAIGDWITVMDEITELLKKGEIRTLDKTSL